MLLRVQRDGAERRVTVDELEAGILRGEIVAEMPLQIDGVWVRAQDWPAWEALRSTPEAALHRLWSTPRVPWVTAGVLGVLVQMHVASFALLLAGDSRLHEALVKEATGIFERQQAWRLVSYGLLHADAGHLLSNSAGLAVAGFGLERLVGHRSTAAVLFTATVAGGAASAWAMPTVPSLGISGGVFGMLGASGVLGLRYLRTIPTGARAAFGTATLPFVAYALWTGTQAERVDNACHFAGLFAGLVLGLVLRPRIPAWSGWNLGSQLAGVGLALATVLVSALAGRQLIPWTAWDADGATAERPAWWEVQVGRAGHSGYGNADRSTVVGLDTARHPAPPTAAELLAEELDDLHRLDPGATMTADGPDRATIRYRVDDGTPRELELRVQVRGLYATVASVDHPAGDPFAPELRARVLDGQALAVPDDLEEDLAGEGSTHWKTRLRAAEARAALGEAEAARAGFEAARASGPAAAVDAAEVRALATMRDPGTAAAIEAALARSPDDRTLMAAAARAYAAIGRAAEARALAQKLVDSAANERGRASAQALLEELGGPAAAAAP